jgi:hypothetical protein
MKELMKHLSCLLILLLAGMALPSCGDDDDEPDDSSVKSLIVGTWEKTYEEAYGSFVYTDTNRMILKADGTGQGIEHYYTTEPDLDPDYYTFTWSYNESTRILTIVEDAYYDSVHGTYDDPDAYSYYVSDINSTKAVLCEYEDGKIDYNDPEVWIRVK